MNSPPRVTSVKYSCSFSANEHCQYPGEGVQGAKYHRACALFSLISGFFMGPGTSSNWPLMGDKSAFKRYPSPNPLRKYHCHTRAQRLRIRVYHIRLTHKLEIRFKPNAVVKGIHSRLSLHVGEVRTLLQSHPDGFQARRRLTRKRPPKCPEALSQHNIFQLSHVFTCQASFQRSSQCPPTKASRLAATFSPAFMSMTGPRETNVSRNSSGDSGRVDSAWACNIPSRANPGPDTRLREVAALLLAFQQSEGRLQRQPQMPAR